MIHRAMELINFQNKEKQKPLLELQAGTGFMMSLTDAIRHLTALGYTENLGAAFDHLSAQSGAIKLYPHEIIIDDIFRFENSSDPDDQSILYAIDAPSRGIKGLYVDSYGFYHDELSHKLLERIKLCRLEQ